MKTLLGIFLVVFGFVIGLYFGLWWAFIGGIIQIIDQIRSPEINNYVLTLGIVKIFFASLIGWVSGLVFIIPGYAFLKN